MFDFHRFYLNNGISYIVSYSIVKLTRSTLKKNKYIVKSLNVILHYNIVSVLCIYLSFFKDNN